MDIHNIVADRLQNPSYRLAVKIVIGQFENEMISDDNDLDYQKNTLHWNGRSWVAGLELLSMF